MEPCTNSHLGVKTCFLWAENSGFLSFLIKIFQKNYIVCSRHAWLTNMRAIMGLKIRFCVCGTMHQLSFGCENLFFVNWKFRFSVISGQLFQKKYCFPHQICMSNQYKHNHVIKSINWCLWNHAFTQTGVWNPNVFLFTPKLEIVLNSRDPLSYIKQYHCLSIG